MHFEERSKNEQKGRNVGKVEALVLKIGDETVRDLENQKLSMKNRMKLAIIKWQINRFRKKASH